MAANNIIREKRTTEIKMGRSKFPGKPSKIGSRKRVNLASCALPEENDSSKAAENIYLGLSVYNETFGDNEMSTPIPFLGFSPIDVETGLAESRLQQKEAEIELKKHNIKENLWNLFHEEFFEICEKCNIKSNNPNAKFEVNKTKQCFDGGGTLTKDNDIYVNENKSDNKPSTCSLSIKLDKSDVASLCEKIKTNKTNGQSYNLLKMNSAKLLQSQAAKRLLKRAKQSTLSETNEKKFILPSHSVHSLRVIKPNKRFFDPDDKKPKVSIKKVDMKKKINVRQDRKLKLSKNMSKSVELIIENDNASQKESIKNEDSMKLAKNPSSMLASVSGKVILREARLQLDTQPSTITEGPFSSNSSSSALSPNSQSKVKVFPSASAPGKVICGVCGAVRFYRFVKQARKFGIFCCESCRKFMSRIIKKYMMLKSSEVKFECIKGQGHCTVSALVGSQYWSLVHSDNNTRCQACWLKLCLRSFIIPTKLKLKLIELLPNNMRNISTSSTLSASNKFLLADSNINDFRWLHQSNQSSKVTSTGGDSCTDAPDEAKTAKSGRKSARAESKKRQQGREIVGDRHRRQSIDLKGPRVKHVCRSAMVVLGQPQATVAGAGDLTGNKKSDANKVESTGEAEVVARSKVDETSDSGTKENKIVAQPAIQAGKTNAKRKRGGECQTENLISMDFWESYDPDEVCEYGFSLIGSEQFSVRALCYLCGSSGLEKMIHCASCCEPYHEFCIDGGQVKESGRCEDTWTYTWVCPKCTVCATCGKTSGQQQRCIRCDNTYHTECMDRLGGRMLHSPDRPWVCSACLRCKSCNTVEVSMFVGNLPLCQSCFLLRQKGNYCPLCQRCYEDDDYDSKMMECGRCSCWVHAKCEGLSDEKYQVLSYLPESVEYVCRVCCVMPPAPWWLAVEAELKAGYLGVLKTLSKNRKACTMLRWSPRKQCTCRSRVSEPDEETGRQRTLAVKERKASIEVINHPTETLKMTLKIMKTGEDDSYDKFNLKECSVRVKKCLFNNDDEDVDVGEESSRDNLTSDSGLGSTDDELKNNCLTDEDETFKNVDEDGVAKEIGRRKSSSSTSECFCFLEVDSYNSRSKPFSPNLLSIKKKVTTSEYPSLHQFHQDMEQMIAATQSAELMDFYHQTVKEIFPWFDPKYSRVQTSSHKHTTSPKSAENTPVKLKSSEVCLVPSAKLKNQPLDYYYSGYTVEDTRACVMCKVTGDCSSNDEGRLLYCGQNEWVHSNCILWSGEVFEEIDGSLQNVYSAIVRGQRIKCSGCESRGASIGCCAKNCSETYHFRCAREIGCVFMDDKTVYCPLHATESLGKPQQNESEFEIRRPVYVELDKRRMKSAECSQIKLIVGSLSVESLGRFIPKLSDYEDAIIPGDFTATRLFWSCYEPWRIVRYRFTVRFVDVEEHVGDDLGVNLTIDHASDPDVVCLKMKQLRHFQQHLQLLDIDEQLEVAVREKRKMADVRHQEHTTTKRPKKEKKVVRKIFQQDNNNHDSNKYDDQNTADLLPPDIEEAIFKDLPHDILDGILMQDIFMDPYENTDKDDDVEGDINKSELWLLNDDLVTSNNNNNKQSKELKRSKSDVVPAKKNKQSHQRSCSLNWSCKFNNQYKLKRNSRCINKTNSEMNLDNYEKLKLTDNHQGGVGGPCTEPGKDLKESLRLIQHEEGKENKFLQWHARLLQVDGGVDSSSSGSEAGESPQRTTSGSSEPVVQPRVAGEADGERLMDESYKYLKIQQYDGNVDSGDEDEEEDGMEMILPLTTVDEEPVRCSQCRCTYRTSLSYQKHLDNCNRDYMLSSSEEEHSDCPPDDEQGQEKSSVSAAAAPVMVEEVEKVPEPVTPLIVERKIKPRTYTRRKPRTVQTPVNIPDQIVNTPMKQQPIMVPTLIVQDIPAANLMPSYIDNQGVQYITQAPYSKPLITSSPLVPNTFHLQPVQNNLLSLQGIIMQPTPSVPPPAPIMMTPTYEVIQDPQTGGVYLASHNQPIYYNMETIVSNTVMQTNRYMSNVMAATSSFSQTSTQVFQAASKLEQVVNVPSGYIVVNQAPPVPQPPPPHQSYTSSPPVAAPRVIPPVIHTYSNKSKNLKQQQQQQRQPQSRPLVDYINNFKSCDDDLPPPAPPVVPATTTPGVHRPIYRPPVPPLYVPSSNQEKFNMSNKYNSTQVNKTSPLSVHVPPQTVSLPPTVLQRKTEHNSTQTQVHLPPPAKLCISMPSLDSPTPPSLHETINNIRQPVSNRLPTLQEHVNNRHFSLQEVTSSRLPSLQNQTNKRSLSVPESTNNNRLSQESNKLFSPITGLQVATNNKLASLPESANNKTRLVEESPNGFLPLQVPTNNRLLSEQESANNLLLLQESTNNKLRLLQESTNKMPSQQEPTCNKLLPLQESTNNKLPPQPDPANHKPSSVQDPTNNKQLTSPLLPLQESTNNNVPSPHVNQSETVMKPENNNSKKSSTVKVLKITPRMIETTFKHETDENGVIRLDKPPKKEERAGPKFVFDVVSDDGFKFSSSSMVEVWQKICESVQEMRAAFKIPSLPTSPAGNQVLGTQNHGLQHLLEQIPGVGFCVKYQQKYFKPACKSTVDDDLLSPVKENVSGCARSECFTERKDHDTFGWLASRHRRLTRLKEDVDESVAVTNRRANSLPMAMRYRHLTETCKLYVGVYRSKIHGKGLFCLREIEAGEMVIEYAGEVIRSSLTDKREKYYTDKNIGCYMFRIDDHYVVDATIKGNAARFINHSCEPNCYSKVVDILGKKHIVIFALRRINIMEELTYDYKFPFEDEKISCHCQSKKCRKYLN